MNTLLANQAFVNSLVSLVTNLALVVGFVAAYIKLRTTAAQQGEKITAVKEQATTTAKAVAGGAGSPVTINVPPAVGTGRTALAAPVWNQLDDPLPDGALDPQSATDCGEESVAMAIAACGGPPLPAGVLRQILGGPARTGTTTAAELSYLLSLFGIKNHARRASADAAWVEWQHSYEARYLVLALGYWVTPGYAHWVLVRQTLAGLMQFNDPWGGELRSLPVEEAQKLYMGVYVHLDQPIAAPAAPAPAT